MQMIRVLALDVGMKRTGIAIGQSITQTAQPLRVVQVPAAQLGSSHVEAWVREWRVSHIVMGLPVHDDGSEHPLHVHIYRLKASLEKRFGLPVALVSEYLSSHEARARGATRANVDAMAAVVLAEDWLAGQKMDDGASKALCHPN